jgi:hypothetical protein
LTKKLKYVRVMTMSDEDKKENSPKSYDFGKYEKIEVTFESTTYAMNMGFPEIPGGPYVGPFPT